MTTHMILATKKFSIFFFFVFLEWVEFTPFEYGSPGFGVFGKTSHFGGKYYKGRLVTEYGEPPLHFLQGN